MGRVWWGSALLLAVACKKGTEPLPGELTIGPTELAFGVVGVGSSASLDVTLANGDTTDVSLLSVTLTDGDSDVFDIDKHDVSTVTAGTSAVVTVTFWPEDEQTYTGQLQIRTDHDELGNVLVALGGRGGPSDADEDYDGYSLADGDCDDGNPDIHPGAAEACDGRDTNCDGVVPANEADADGDRSRVCDGDCDDTNNTRYPGAPELCDGLDNDCDGSVNESDDLDGDGFSICAGDCDDTEDRSFPGNTETCDGVDNDCDGSADNIDEDGDGHSVCSATGDCDDHDPDAYPITVSPSGSSTGAGTDADPVDSIATALTMLDTTCRVVSLLPGTYTDVSESWSSGTVTIGGQTGDPDDVVLEASSYSRHFTITGGSMVLRELTLTGGESTEDGGAVRVTNGALEMNRVTARDNRSDLDGGAVAVLSGNLTLRRTCRFEGNQAGEDGGAVQVDAATITDTGSVYVSNLAPAGQGGALSINGGTATVEGGEFRSNQADEGGAIAILNTGDFVVQRNRLVLNSATSDGGGFSFRDVNDLAGTVRNNRVQDNTAGGMGGGAAFVGYNGALQFVNNTLTGNDAVGEGAIAVAIAGSGAGIAVASNVLQDNDGPSGIYAAPTATSIVLYNTVYLQNSGISFEGACGDGSGNPLDPSNVVRNPQLVAVSDNQNPDDDDLHLQGTSPEIDSGVPQPVFDDLDGSVNDRGWTGGPGAQ